MRSAIIRHSRGPRLTTRVDCLSKTHRVRLGAWPPVALRGVRAFRARVGGWVGARMGKGRSRVLALLGSEVPERLPRDDAPDRDRAAVEQSEQDRFDGWRVARHAPATRDGPAPNSNAPEDLEGQAQGEPERGPEPCRVERHHRSRSTHVAIARSVEARGGLRTWSPSPGSNPLEPSAPSTARPTEPFSMFSFVNSRKPCGCVC